jgi:hypothetical protein
MIEIKPGVQLWALRPQMLIALHVLECLFEKQGKPCVITAGNDGKHKDFSFHYSGNALDIRTNNLASAAVATGIAVEAQAALGADFYVLYEGDHIHVQYKPKGI